jgi:hypothetical protein
MNLMEGVNPKKRRRRTTTNAARGFKKDFNPLPSQLSDRLSASMKSRPSRSMVAEWWSQEHPDIKLVDSCVEWLAGFYNCLGDNELHPADRDHLEELTAWHETKENECMDDTQPIAGPSC